MLIFKFFKPFQKNIIIFFKCSLVFFFLAAFFLVFKNSVSATTEFISIVDPDNALGTDFTTLSAWESAVQADLTSSATKVFSYATTTESIPDGATVIGATSGAKASSTHVTASTTSSQIMLTNITGTFQADEKVYVEGSVADFVYIIDNGDSVIAVAKCRSTGGSYDESLIDIEGWTTSIDNYIKIWTDPTDEYGRHNGTIEEGIAYTMKSSSAANNSTLKLWEDYVIIDGIKIIRTDDNWDYGNAIEISESSYSTIKNNLLVQESIGSSITPKELLNFQRDNTTNLDLKIFNNIFISKTSELDYGMFIDIDYTDTAAEQSEIYNNTIYGYFDEAAVYINNAYVADDSYGVLFFNNYAANIHETTTKPDYLFDGFYYATSTIFTNNASDDTSAGTDNLNRQVSIANADFNNIYTYDLHLGKESVLKNQATSSLIVSDGDIEGYYYDIDNTARGNLVDIGADEVPVDFVSTICENSLAGGDCVNYDYSNLARWEDKVECDLTASTTRVFGGTINGILSENDILTLVYPDYATTSVTMMVVATSSDQILIDEVSGTSTPLILPSNTKFCSNTATCPNYWIVSGSGEDFGASVRAVGKIDGEWSSTDNNDLYIYDWVSDQDNYIKIYTTDLARHNGKPSTANYKMMNSNGDYFIRISQMYTDISGIELDCNGGMGITIYEKNVKVHDNVIYGFNGTNRHGIYYNSSNQVNSNVKLYIYNNILLNSNPTGTGGAGIYVGAPNTMTYIYNNTIYNIGGDGRGIRSNPASNNNVIVKNNLIASTTDPFYGIFHADSANNATDNDDSPSAGTNNFTNKTFSFEDKDNNDLHLKIDDTGAKNLATTTITAISNFIYDIDGELRPTDNWDIGADEFVSPISLKSIYRSIGNDLRDLSNSATVDISSTSQTATFSAAQPDNIGEGDVIQFGETGYYDLAFITARASSTVFSIQSSTGEIPTATSSANFKIFRAYLKMDDWEDNIVEDVNSGIDDSVDDLVVLNNDLTASNIVLMLACYASSSVDNLAVDIDGWETSDTNYIKIYATSTARHLGKWDDNKYNLTVNTAGAVLNINDDYVKIDGLQIAYDGSNDAGIALNVNGNEDFDISNTIFKVSGTDSQSGIEISSNVDKVRIWNNIIYDFENNGIKSSAVNAYVYNNTIYNIVNYGLETVAGTLFAKNNIVQKSGNNAYQGSFSNSDYNISDDSTDTGGANDQSDVSVIFLSTSTADFRLDSTDTIANNTGANLKNDSFLSFDTDIEGETRGVIDWDIGADECASSTVPAGPISTTTLLYRSVGNDSTDLSNTANVTITTNDKKAVFSVDQPDNIGVGDVIQFGNSGYYDLVFITKRLSASEYNVQARENGTLIATTSASAKIFRAFLKMDDWEDHLVEDVNSGIDDSVDDFVLVDQNLAGNNSIMMAACYESSVVDDQPVYISGWQTSETNYINIFTPNKTYQAGISQRHKGKAGSGYRLHTSINGSHCINIGVDYTVIDGLEIKQESTGSSDEGIRITASAGATIKNSIIWTAVKTNDQDGIYAGDYSVAEINIYNTIVYGFYRAGIHAQNYSSAGVIQNWNIINCTVYNCGTIGDNESGGLSNRGISSSNVTMNVKNSIVMNTSGGDDYERYGPYSSWGDSQYNISEDASAPCDYTDYINKTATDNKNPGSGDWVIFKNLSSGEEDFHIINHAENDAIDLGTSNIQNLTDDIDGNFRGAWDIGADEAAVVFTASIMQSGGDFSSLASWEAGSQVDLLDDGTAVFSISAYNGSIPLWADVTGATSGAIASTTVVSTSSNQVLLYNISGKFAAGEQIQLNGATSNNVTISDAGNPAIVFGKIDGAWNSSDISAVKIDGWMTGVDNYIKIFATGTARHLGKWNNNKYNLKVNATGAIFDIAEDFVYLDGLQISYDGNDDSGIALSINGNNDFDISNTIIKVSGTDSQSGIEISSNVDKVRIWNNIIYDFENNGIKSSADNAYIYNNTIYGASYGIERNAGIVVAKNNIVQNTGNNAYQGIFTNSDYNLSDDSTDTNGLNDINDATVLFSSISTKDFHLNPSDTSANSAGTSTANDLILSFLTDIDNENRGLDWDIGADQNDEDPPVIEEIISYNASIGEDIDIETGLAGYWSFNDKKSTTTLADNSENNNNGLWSGSSEYWNIDGVSGNSGKFNGSNNFVTINDDASLSFDSTDFSILTWIKFSENDADDIIISKLDAENDGYSLSINNSGKILCSLNAIDIESHIVNDNQWHFIGCVFDRSDYGSIYLDGKLIKSEKISGETISESSNLIFGKSSYSDNNYLSAKIDEIRIYNKILTNLEINHIYNRGLASSEWHFRNNYQDKASLCKFGNCKNMNSGGTGNAFDKGYLEHAITALTLNGSGYASMSDDDYFDIGSTSDFTIVATIKTNTTLTAMTLFSKKLGILVSNPGYTFDISETNVLSLDISDGLNNYKISSNQTINDNQWHTLIAVFDEDNENNCKIYIDANNKTDSRQGDIEKIGDLSNNTSINIASLGNLNQKFIGSIDRIAFFPYAFDRSDVLRESIGGYEVDIGVGARTKTTGVNWDPFEGNFPVAWWKFDEMKGTVVKDYADNSLNGVFNGNGNHWKKGKKGMGGNFNGIDDFVDFGDLNINAKSINFWIKPKSNTESIIDFDGGSHTITTSGGTISANGFVSPSIYVNGVLSSIVDNNWNYVSIVTDTAIDLNNTDIGRISSEYFNGIIDDIRIYDYVRSHAQLIWDYNKGLPVGYWKFDDAASGSADGISLRDSSENLNNASGYDGGNDTGLEWTNQGKIENALVFDGIDDFVDIGDLGLEIKTISFWLKADTLTEDIIDLDNGSHYIFVNSGNVSTNGFVSPSIYVNGKIASTVNTNWNHVLISTETAINVTDFDIGRIGSDYFQGTIDDVKVYNYVLTKDQIKENYNGGNIYFGK